MSLQPSGTDFISRVLDVVNAIPAAHVMTYGDVAATIGSHGARAVGQTMARYGSEVNWWRVIRASGHAAAGLELSALTHYLAEETPLHYALSGTYRVDLAGARYRP